MYQVQTVEYFEDNVVFKKGPFVICNLLSNGWRIEVELKGHHCPILPNISVYKIMEKLEMTGNTHNREKAELICAVLNSMVEQGKIVCKNGMWVAKDNRRQ